MKEPVKVGIYMRPGHHPDNRILIDGVVLRRTHNIEFSAPVHGPISVLVEFWADEVSVEGEDFEMEVAGRDTPETVRLSLEELKAFLTERR